MCSKPGSKKSKGENDLEALTPLHPAPAVAATAQNSSQNQRRLIFGIKDTRNKHPKQRLVARRPPEKTAELRFTELDITGITQQA